MVLKYEDLLSFINSQAEEFGMGKYPDPGAIRLPTGTNGLLLSVNC